MAHIHRSITIAALIDDVWAYLTESDKIAQWLMPNTFVAKPGHAFTMDCPPGIGSGAPVRCEVMELQPPEKGRARLAYTWVIDEPYTETLLEIELIEVARETRCDLVHSGWRDGKDALRDRHEEGWDVLLDTRLRSLLEGS
ncbi:SRPBCC domain-containing protein [Nitratireductor sp. XY-223]|uniref:SRPBCC family protein n=1 Tax=Nitratireductor sp. XY-223 TaxID=2561926 RepID=UPI0010AA20F3|nr:SRPBCC domain-containing protein [Nitratireductor sp. XY-223]